MKGIFKPLKAGLTLAVAIAITGCVKKREDIVAQGQEQYLQTDFAIANVHGKTCQITTGEKIQTVRNTVANTASVDSSAATTLSNGQKSGIRFLDIVDYSSNCPYLNEPEIKERMELRAEPNTTYPAVFEVAENYVTVYKLVSEEQVSHLEVPYSKFANGYWYVPVGGWAASFYRAEKQRNADNRETNQRLAVRVLNKDFQSATHVELDPTKFRKFKSLDKVDMLPRDFFEGEWYFAETVVNTSYQSGQVLGGVHGLLGAERIKFLVEEGNIFALDVNIDEELAGTDNHLNFISSVKIPATLRSYRRALDQGLEEVVHATLKSEEADFVELDFVKVETPRTVIGAGEGVLGQIFSRLQSITVMKDIIVQDGFLSFTIEDNRIQNKTRYTFLRADANRDYERRQFHLADHRKFGFFASEKDQIRDHRINRHEDYEALMSISRFNPKKDIIYYFSDITPGGPNDPDREQNAWVRDVGREAINLWQQAFKKAGLDINIILDESKDVALGDIRYNVINLVGENVGSIIGYGPSLTEPWTGEVISATANTFLAGIREGVVGNIRQYIAQETKRYYDFTNPNIVDSRTAGSARARSILSRLGLAVQYRRIESEKNEYGMPTGRIVGADYPKMVAPGLSSEVALAPIVTDAELKELSELLKNEGLGLVGGRHNQLADVMGFHASLTSGLESFQRYYSESMSIQDQNLLFHTATGYESALRSNTAYLAEYVRNNCPDVMALIQQVNATGVSPSTQQENDVILPCARTFEIVDALSTTVHEIGHNLGLRHNFNGSADVDNFLPHSEFVLKYIEAPQELFRTHSSSIMDYIPASWGIQVTPGGYDVAALRFGYRSEIELAGGGLPGTGNVVKVPNDKPLEVYLAAKPNLKPRDYGFCTDEDAYLLMNNPFCTLHDMGSSAVDIARNWIYNTFNAIEILSYRYDRRLAGDDFVYVARYSLELKRIYEQWRLYLKEYVNRRFSGDQGSYLESLSLNQYQSLIEEMLQDPIRGETYRDFYAARNLIFNFWLDLATLPNRYCIAEHETLGEKLYELETIRVALRGQGSKSTVRNCAHPEVQEFLAENGFSFKEEVGHFLNPGVYSLNPNDLFSLNPEYVSDFFDFGGTLMTRLISSIFMVERSAISLSNQLEGYHPSFLDEPDARAVMEAAVQTRVTHGVNWRAEAFDADKLATAKVLTVEDYIRSRKFLQRGGNPLRPTISLSGRMNFDAEVPLLFNNYVLLLAHLNAPNFNPGDDKRVPYRAYSMRWVDLQEILNDPNRSGAVADYLVFGGGSAIYVQPENTFSRNLIQIYKQLSSQLSADNVDVSTFQVVKDSLDRLNLYSSETQVTFMDILRILLTMDSFITQAQRAGMPPSSLQEFSEAFAIENAVFSFVMQNNMLAQFGITTNEEFNALLNYAIQKMQETPADAPTLAAAPTVAEMVDRIGLAASAHLYAGDFDTYSAVSAESDSGAVQIAGGNANFDAALALDLTELYKANELPLPSKSGVELRISQRKGQIEQQQLKNKYYRNEINAQLTLISTMLSVGSSF